MKVRFFNIIFEIIIGFILADLFTGTIHWFEDTYLSYWTNNPLLKTISKDNELHHYFPRSITAYSYLDHMSVTLPFTIIMVILIYLTNKKFMMEHIFFFITFFTFVLLSNVIHRLSHMRDCEKSKFIINIQKIGLLCSHEHHAKHHDKTLEKYCVICEYNNYILDNINFWRTLEYIIYVITGMEPDRKKRYNEYKEIHTYLHANSKLKCPNKPTKAEVNELITKLDDFKKKELQLK